MSPDSDYFAVDYFEGKDELFYLDGEVLKLEPISWLYPGGDFFLITAEDGDKSSLWHKACMEPLVNLEQAPYRHYYVLNNQGLIVVYTNGEAYLISMTWLEKMQGTPQKLLATPNELIRIACQPFNTSILFDKMMLTSRLNGRQPSDVCQ